MSGLQLIEVRHPCKDAADSYEALVGLEAQQQALLDELTLILDVKRSETWLSRHHPDGLPAASALAGGSPLLLLSGEVGCGKTALATSIGTPLARQLERKVIALETPSNIRGGGLVGELSSRITEAFQQACGRAKYFGCGLLIIDEADDLATAREQMQAHHEDRAGVNVLIKQIDEIVRNRVPLAVLLITNRSSVLDPAVVRRATLQLRFNRPSEAQRRAVMKRLLTGTEFTKKELDALATATAPRRGVPFCFSDLTVRLLRCALRRALGEDRPFGPAVLQEALEEIEPSPLLGAPLSEEIHGDA
jgi:AAA+ superfamily predicted ATPase